jgi:hypothetical protein
MYVARWLELVIAICKAVALCLFMTGGAAMSVGMPNLGYAFFFVGGLVVLTKHGLEGDGDQIQTE